MKNENKAKNEKSDKFSFHQPNVHPRLPVSPYFRNHNRSYATRETKETVSLIVITFNKKIEHQRTLDSLAASVGVGERGKARDDTIIVTIRSSDIVSRTASLSVRHRIAPALL